MFIRLSVFWKNQQLDVSLPANRPIVDLIDDVSRLLTSSESEVKNPGNTVVGTDVWVLSSPTTGVLEPDTTLAEANILDGQRLYLTQRSEAAYAPFVDDVLNEVRTAISDQRWRWSGATRKQGYLISAGILSLVLLFPSFLMVATAPSSFGQWTATNWVMLGFTTTITLVALVVSILQPHSSVRWFSLLLPIIATAGSYPFFVHLRAGQELPLVIAVATATSIPVAVISGLKRERNGLAGSLALLFITLIMAGVFACDYFGLSVRAVAVWSSWFPIFVLIIASGMAVRTSGLSILLRLSDSGKTIDRELIRSRTLRSASINAGFVWAATGLGLLICITLFSSPYWQHGICAGILSLILIMRSNAFSDARLIAPLILSGALAVSIAAASIYWWISHKGKSPAEILPWWTQPGSQSWLAWLIFGCTLLLLAIILLLLSFHTPHDVEEARTARVFSAIESILSIVSIPAILIAQGVVDYYWAII